MHRMLLALIAASSALYATSTATSSCTAGSTTETPCPANINLTPGISGPGYHVSAFAQASDSSIVAISFIRSPQEFEPGFGWSMSAIAEMEEQYLGEPNGPLPPLSATANASANIVAYTAAPAQLGSIVLSVSTGTGHDAFGAEITVTDGVHTYGLGSGAPPRQTGCGFDGCFYTATLPFDVGSEFEVSISANASGSIAPPYPGLGSEAIAELSFEVLSADGGKVPFTLVPEPSTNALLLLGLALGAYWVVKPRRLYELPNS
jgi:hypothetical protein